MTAPARRAWIGLGSNLDRPDAQVRAALAAMHSIGGVLSLRASALYRTPPWGRTDQPDFVNAAAQLETTLAPEDLLRELQQIEHHAGRMRRERWGPRVLDLDLLWHEDGVRASAQLCLPHPQLHERAFVLLPLAELAPDLVVPGHGRVADLLARVDCRGIEALG